MPGWEQLKPGDKCQIVMINGDNTILKRKDSAVFSNGPYIDATFLSYGETILSSHGITPRVKVRLLSNNDEIVQTDMNGYASFYFVVKGGITATFDDTVLRRGGSKSRKHLSRKRKGKKSYRKRKYGKSKKSRRFRRSVRSRR